MDRGKFMITGTAPGLTPDVVAESVNWPEGPLWVAWKEVK